MSKKTTASLIREFGYITLKSDGPKDIPKPEGGFFKSYDRVPRNLYREALKRQMGRMGRFLKGRER